jgi:carbonic anhydrase
MHVYVSVCMHGYLCIPQSLDKVIQSLGAGVISICGQPDCGGWALALRTEQQWLFPTSLLSSPSPRKDFFFFFFFFRQLK